MKIVIFILCTLGLILLPNFLLAHNNKSYVSLFKRIERKFIFQNLSFIWKNKEICIIKTIIVILLILFSYGEYITANNIIIQNNTKIISGLIDTTNEIQKVASDNASKSLENSKFNYIKEKNNLLEQQRTENENKIYKQNDNINKAGIIFTYAKEYITKKTVGELAKANQSPLKISTSTISKNWYANGVDDDLIEFISGAKWRISIHPINPFDDPVQFLQLNLSFFSQADVDVGHLYINQEENNFFSLICNIKNMPQETTRLTVDNTNVTDIALNRCIEKMLKNI